MSKMGRPRLEDPRKNRVNLRFSNEQLARLEAYAEKTGMTKSQVLMYGFEKLLKEEKND